MINSRVWHGKHARLADESAVLAHPKCKVCGRYIPEARIYGSRTKYCSTRCNGLAQYQRQQTTEN